MGSALLAVFIGLTSSYSLADEVEIAGADFQQARNGTWSVEVALLHEDSDWDRYADVWRVVDEEGNVLGERVLLHPHENEQPFVRGNDGVEIPQGSIVYIEAHDMVHGWAKNRLEIDLDKAENGRLTVGNP